MHILIILGIALGFFLLGLEVLNAFTEQNLWRDVFDVLGMFWEAIDGVAIPVIIVVAAVVAMASYAAVRIGEGIAAEVIG